MPITNQLSVEPTYSFNHVTLEQGKSITHLAGSRVTYSMTPLMFVSALLQYNSGIERGVDQRAVQVGVPARQRVVRRLQRGAQHPDAQLSRPQQPRVHREDQSTVSRLSTLSTPDGRARTVYAPRHPDRALHHRRRPRRRRRAPAGEAPLKGRQSSPSVTFTRHGVVLGQRIAF